MIEGHGISTANCAEMGEPIFQPSEGTEGFPLRERRQVPSKEIPSIQT
jgi:hypothetical protein